MHASYISLAFFAIGAIAAPSVPKPSSMGDMAGGFPFNPSGSSSVEDPDSDGFDNPFPQAMQALEQVQSAQAEQPTPTQAAFAKPTHAAMSFPAPAVSQAPVAAPAPIVSAKASPSAVPSSRGLFHSSAKPSAKPSAQPSAQPAAEPSAKPSAAKASTTPHSSSATPSPSASAPAGPLGELVHGIPVVGGLIGDSLGGLGLRR
ncbi:unnamed protein product [Penicillium olsonii]|nr:unnamed protein product [Penicillium olsonii]